MTQVVSGNQDFTGIVNVAGQFDTLSTSDLQVGNDIFLGNSLILPKQRVITTEEFVDAVHIERCSWC